MTAREPLQKWGRDTLGLFIQLSRLFSTVNSRTIPLYQTFFRVVTSMPFHPISAPILADLAAASLKNVRVGLEKEALRTTPQGHLATTPHPIALGAALTHPHITTDYAESLLELVTAPHDQAAHALAQLDQLHRFVHANLADNEQLWAASMPCQIIHAAQIQIANYGNSHLGQLKHIYRRGLGHRYGRMMQIIAGIHFNYSIATPFFTWLADHLGETCTPTWISARYFNAVRNLQTHGWIVGYLFGVSPGVDRSFTAGKLVQLADFDAHTHFHPYATSLRLSDIGYSNANQLEKRRCAAQISFDSLDEYVGDLLAATQTACADYKTLGVQRDGDYLQLNANLLQTENEFYATVRPKQSPHPDERPLVALARRGVGYLELRTLDINPFCPHGVDLPTLHFLEAFILFNLLVDAPPLSRQDRLVALANQQRVALQGRQPQLMLHQQDRPILLRDWANAIFESMAPICAALDAAHQNDCYQKSLEIQRLKLDFPENTPSAQFLDALRQSQLSFVEFSQKLTQQHAEYFTARPLDPQTQAHFETVAQAAIAQQQQLEMHSQTQSFADFLAHYFRWPDDLLSPAVNG